MTALGSVIGSVLEAATKRADADKGPLSPLPWSSALVGGVVSDADGIALGMLRYTRDVNYLLRAANSHAQLVDALRTFVNVEQTTCGDGEHHPALNTARAALAAAGAT